MAKKEIINNENLMTKAEIIDLINMVVFELELAGKAKPKHKPMIMKRMKDLTGDRVDERLLTSTVSEYLVIRKWATLDHSIGREPRTKQVFTKDMLEKVV